MSQTVTQSGEKNWRLFSMIETRGLTKRFGSVLAVDHVDFSVKPGIVTGFLGPNGAGKTTTMKMMIGLDRPSDGTVTINGRPYVEAKAPMRDVGALLEAKAIHGGRNAYYHLLGLARAGGLPDSRVTEVLRMVGLEGVAKKRTGGFSLGMNQRLGIASALLGDPGVLILDEPVNGLDPEGIAWARNLMRSLAAEGRTVLVSSHLMSEMAQTADHLIVIGKGRLLADATTEEILSRQGGQSVAVRSPHQADLADRVQAAGGAVAQGSSGELVVTGMDAATVGELSAANGFVLHELTSRRGNLEEAFMEMTRSSVEFAAASPDNEGREGAWAPPDQLAQADQRVGGGEAWPAGRNGGGR